MRDSGLLPNLTDPPPSDDQKQDTNKDPKGDRTDEVKLPQKS